MVSISNISVGHATFYYRRDDFTKESMGEWYGKGASTIGLAGFIKHEDYLAIITGKDPKDAQQLVRSGVNGKHRAGIDLTFSAPKSVSIAGLVLGNEQIIKAHGDAVYKTLSHIEKNFTQARITQNNVTGKIKTSNMIIATFEHHLSREIDPQLHTHCVIMNMTKTGNGWRAISNEQLFDHKMYLGQFYRNELAKNLMDADIQIHSNNHGLFEIKGIDQQILKVFSQRSKQILEKIQELKEQDKYSKMYDQKLREIATLSSRESKKSLDIREVEQHWAGKLLAAGLTRENINYEIHRQSVKGKESFSASEVVKMAITIAAEREGTFAKKDVLMTAAKRSLGHHRIVTLERSFRNFVTTGEIEKLDNGKFTKKAIKDLEKNMIQVVEGKQEKHDPNLPSEKAQKESFDKEVCQGKTENTNREETVMEEHMSRVWQQGRERDK